jgi:small-conductance mechanosensitive channel
MLSAASPLAFAMQTATPTPGVGVGELADYWPTVSRGLWFLAGFLAAALLGRFVAAPPVSRLVRRRNRNNPTIEETISRYVRLLAVVVAAFVGAGVAGYGGFVAGSAIVVAAATLAIGVAGRTVIGSLVSGVVLVLDPEFNVGNYIEWSDGQGTVRSITRRSPAFTPRTGSCSPCRTRCSRARPSRGRSARDASGSSSGSVSRTRPT